MILFEIEEEDEDEVTVEVEEEKENFCRIVGPLQTHCSTKALTKVTDATPCADILNDPGFPAARQPVFRFRTSGFKNHKPAPASATLLFWQFADEEK